jgi:hypothetical protein
LAREALIERRRLVASDETAEHIAGLLAAGWKRVAIAGAGGSESCSDHEGFKRAGGSINRSTAEKILAHG